MENGGTYHVQTGGLRVNSGEEDVILTVEKTSETNKLVLSLRRKPKKKG